MSDPQPQKYKPTMVEHVAKEMCRSVALNCHVTSCARTGTCNAVWHEKDAMMVMARAAIAAMMEPTPRMILAGRQEPPEQDIRPGTNDCDVNPIRGESKTVLRYRAMIEAALK